MNVLKRVLGGVLSLALAACGVSAERFPGTAVAPPVALAGQWQLQLGGETIVYAVTPAATHHFSVTVPNSNDPAATMDASIQVFEDTRYLVIADPTHDTGVTVFRVLDVAPTVLRIAALDPARTKAVLAQRGMPFTMKKMLLYEELVLTAPALQTVLALPPADVFAVSDSMVLRRMQ